MRRAHSLLLAAVVIGPIVGLRLSVQVRNGAPSQPISARNIQWSTARPRDLGIDAAALESIYFGMDQEPKDGLKGIVIVRAGELVREHYFNGDSLVLFPL
jgi:hypothetical protein